MYKNNVVVLKSTCQRVNKELQCRSTTIMIDIYFPITLIYFEQNKQNRGSESMYLGGYSACK